MSKTWYAFIGVFFIVILKVYFKLKFYSAGKAVYVKKFIVKL